MIGEPQELVLSDRVTVTVAELDGFELEKAELLICEIIGKDAAQIPDQANPDVMTFDPSVMTLKMAAFETPVFARCSVQTLNGQPMNPLKNLAEYSRVAKQIGARERVVLYEWANSVYRPSTTQVKNSEGAQPQ